MIAKIIASPTDKLRKQASLFGLMLFWAKYWLGGEEWKDDDSN